MVQEMDLSLMLPLTEFVSSRDVMCKDVFGGGGRWLQNLMTTTSLDCPEANQSFPVLCVMPNNHFITANTNEEVQADMDIKVPLYCNIIKNMQSGFKMQDTLIISQS